MESTVGVGSGNLTAARCIQAQCFRNDVLRRFSTTSCKTGQGQNDYNHKSHKFSFH